MIFHKRRANNSYPSFGNLARIWSILVALVVSRQSKILLLTSLDPLDGSNLLDMFH